jgi:hypothetical protein
VHGHGRMGVAIRVRHATQLAISDAARRVIEERLSDLKPLGCDRLGDPPVPVSVITVPERRSRGGCTSASAC